MSNKLFFLEKDSFLITIRFFLNKRNFFKKVKAEKRTFLKIRPHNVDCYGINKKRFQTTFFITRFLRGGNYSQLFAFYKQIFLFFKKINYLNIKILFYIFLQNYKIAFLCKKKKKANRLLYQPIKANINKYNTFFTYCLRTLLNKKSLYKFEDKFCAEIENLLQRQQESLIYSRILDHFHLTFQGRLNMKRIKQNRLPFSSVIRA